MTKYETLDNLNGNMIIQIMLVPEEQMKMQPIIDEFYNYNYHLPISVLNAALIFSIQSTKANDMLPNIVYLRKTMETFESYKLDTTAKAIIFLDKKKEYNKTKAIKRVPIAEPEWMQDYVDKIAAMEEEQGITWIDKYREDLKKMDE